MTNRQGGFTAIDLSRLPAPQVVETLDYERLLQAIKDDFARRAPAQAAVLDLESEPLVKLLESAAYTVLHLRQRVNDAAHGVMLAYATGADLDNLAALFGVARQVVDAGNPDARPPLPPTYETDERLRQRVQLSLEGHSTAGPVGSYVFWGLSADPKVKDIDVQSPAPGRVQVTVLSQAADGTPARALLDRVTLALNHEEVRPLTDRVSVQGAEIIHYEIVATLTLATGPDAEVVRTAASQAVTAYVAEHHALGQAITLSGLYAALHQPGVQNVMLESPAADIAVQSQQAAWCTAISITVGDSDA